MNMFFGVTRCGGRSGRHGGGNSLKGSELQVLDRRHPAAVLIPSGKQIKKIADRFNAQIGKEFLLRGPDTFNELNRSMLK
jgi:hypothetical protein